MLGSKEQVVAIRTINGQMVLNTMFFKDEIQRSPANIEGQNISEKELSLARIIIENMSSKFEPEKYKDEYRERVLGAIKSKIKGKKITAPREEYAEYGNIVNLMEALQKSVQQTPKKSKKSKSSASRKSSKNSTSNQGERTLSEVFLNSSKSAKSNSQIPVKKKKSSEKQVKSLSSR
ncbi:MAG: hypothetical protein EOM55_04465 [Clostridia bacterium]|nr:hypothetical protein [Clostridia bacterium]